MIKSIKNIKDLGIFSECRWDASLKEFKQYNLFYGWNGSGKTTLTNLFNIIGGDEQSDFPDCSYLLDCEEGQFTNAEVFPKNIRVFNQKYMERNLALHRSSTNPIFVLGEESKELAAQIEADEILLNGDSHNAESIGLIASLKQAKEKREAKENERSKQFTNVAKLIGSSTAGVLPRNYRKPQAETEFDKLKSKELQQKESLERLRLTLSQKQMASNLSTLNTDPINSIRECIQAAKSLLSESVESVIIERLSDDEIISNWVENGLKIHIDKELTQCEFCEQPIPQNRLKALLSHFNEADKILKGKIDSLLERLRKIYAYINALSPIDDANLYEEYRKEYSTELQRFSKLRSALLDDITKFGEALNKKKMNTTTSLELSETIETNEILACIRKMSDIIKSHCEKAQDFDTERKNAAKKLERHYLSEIFETVRNLDSEILKIKSLEKELAEGDGDKKLGINQLKSRIESNRIKISNAGPAVDAINEGLCTFLGRSEIQFSLEGEGYKIYRNGKPVTNLSEGEKTAIAFVYFTIHLDDINFNKSDGIIVIDDPISSLDSSSLFQAFAFLKNAVIDAHQVFILTHNFDFLRLILGWLNNSAYKKKRGYYMIHNKFSADERVASIGELDKTLVNFESEYQFLFKQLYEFVSDGTIAGVYHIPNIARKVLETFLMLMFPDARRVFAKLEDLDFDKTKKTSIYKFTNDQSHMTGKGFDPSLVPECQKSVKYLLEMIETTFPSHYKSLEDQCALVQTKSDT